MPVPWDNQTELVKSALELTTRQGAKKWLSETIARFVTEKQEDPERAFRTIRVALTSSKAWLEPRDYLRLKYLYGYPKESHSAREELEKLDKDSYIKVEGVPKLEVISEKAIEEAKKTLTDAASSASSFVVPYIPYPSGTAANTTGSFANSTGMSYITMNGTPINATGYSLTYTNTTCLKLPEPTLSFYQVLKDYIKGKLKFGEWFVADFLPGKDRMYLKAVSSDKSRCTKIFVFTTEKGQVYQNEVAEELLARMLV